MSNKINLNELWSGQKSEQPNTSDLLLKMQKFNKENRKKIIITNVLLGLTSIFILFIWYYYKPQFISTKLGIITIIVAMLIFLISSNRSLVLFNKPSETESNQAYLKNLLKIKEKQQYLQTTILNLYFVLLSTGILLYLYEYASRMTTVWAVVTYSLSGIWILLNWFYLRPRQIKKQQAKINEIISNVEKIQEQLKQE